MPEIEARPKLHLPSARQLRAIRSWLGMHQSEFASRADVSLSTITDFEKGHRPIGKDTLYSIAKAINDLGVKFRSGSPVLPE